MLTNTLFSHNLCHRTTWTAPERYHTSSKDDQGNPQLLLGPDNLPRREPFRNQIDYIIATKIKHRKCLTNARSYGGIKSYTDHRLVKMSMNFQWHKLQKQMQRTNMTNITNFSDREKQTLYNQEIQNTFQPSVATTLVHRNSGRTSQMYACKDTGKEILGQKDRKQKINDPELKELLKKKS